MDKESFNCNKKYFEHYIARRNEEFRCQYNHEHSWEKLQCKLQKRRMRLIGLYCMSVSAALFFLMLGISYIFSLYNSIQNKVPMTPLVVSFPETGGRKAILTLENGKNIDLSVEKGSISNVNSTVINNADNRLLIY